MRLLRTKRNAVFYADRLALILDGDDERIAAIQRDPTSVELLTWNIFASLATHTDQRWLAHRLQVLGGATLRAPVRIHLWTGRDREPLLRPSQAYVGAVRRRSAAVGGNGTDLTAFTQAIDLPVRMESPDTLVLADTLGDRYSRGGGGRDRLLELIDAGLDHARRLSCSLTVAVIYPSGTQAAGELSARVNDLRDPGTLRRELAHRTSIEPLALRELSWQRLVHLWQAERAYLDLSGQPVKAFLAQLEERGLR